MNISTHLFILNGLEITNEILWDCLSFDDLEILKSEADMH
ncbi:hypothetical protein GCAAIG_07895 [Candidatus Electronema halotolerans]